MSKNFQINVSLSLPPSTSRPDRLLLHEKLQLIFLPKVEPTKEAIVRITFSQAICLSLVSRSFLSFIPRSSLFGTLAVVATPSHLRDKIQTKLHDFRSVVPDNLQNTRREVTTTNSRMEISRLCRRIANYIMVIILGDESRCDLFVRLHASHPTVLVPPPLRSSPSIHRNYRRGRSFSDYTAIIYNRAHVNTETATISYRAAHLAHGKGWSNHFLTTLAPVTARPFPPRGNFPTATLVASKIDYISCSYLNSFS